ncbi:MAG: sigma-24, subfamily [Acidobacteriaceae bacterium]|nr:sigma-24, subfamily [Acidobacteriaceae bacterium]
MQPDSSDAALIARIRAGDEDAMAQVYDRHSQIVYSVALRVLGDTGAAEDVMQEIFMQLWRNPQTFDANRGSLGAWLAVIARHRSIDQLRKRKPETDLEDVIVSVDANLESETDKNVSLAKVRGLLGSMPADQRKTLELAFFEGLTHSEVAEKLGEPLGTVKTRIRTGLMAMRKALGN